ncbi:MAG TPA: hypothetical protein DCZ95_15190 [Verrucomicrobia bacterium]|nr:MAG: hypothetical protein A2X46_18945 [Lentisphaerae bacterium GWF2_57_35]HBA85430.1 hypothetical protein [Verrucomicrobiota bacterium]
MNWRNAGVVVCLVVLFSRFTAVAEIPQQFYFEDYYSDTNGVPFTGDVSLRLQLYDAATGGSCYYEDSNTVAVTDGLYSTTIGDDTVFGSVAAALASGETYVQVIIDGAELNPREPLVPQPYAIRAAGVSSNAITSEMISANAIQGQHLENGAVTSSKIATGTVGTTQLDMAALDAEYVNASGDTMTGSLDMGGFSLANAVIYGNGTGITNLPNGAYTEVDPVWTAEKASYATGTPVYAETDPAFGDWLRTNTYVQPESDPIWTSAEPAYVKADGSRSMSGNLDMGGYSITNIATNTLLFSDGSHALRSSGDTMTGPLYINTKINPSGLYSTGIVIRTTGSGPIIIGNSASGVSWSVSIGHEAKSVNDSVAIGHSANARNDAGSDGVAVGGCANASATGVAIGDMANASSAGSVAVGYLANALGLNSVAIGSSYNQNYALYSEQSVGVGSAGRAVLQSVSVGYQARCVGRSVAIGATADAECWIGGGFNPTGSCMAIGYAANARSLAMSTRENIAIGYCAVANTGINRTAIGSKVQAAPFDQSTTLRGSLYLDGGNSIYYRPQFGSGSWEWQATPHLIVTGEVDVTTIKPLCTGAELVNASSKIWWKALSGDTTNDWVRQLSQDNVIRSDLTLNVPAEYETIQSALSSLSDKSIADGVYVTVQVADGIYTNYSCVNITHRDSDKVMIIGNTNNCELCVLQFALGQTGFSVISRRLSFINGFKLSGTDSDRTRGLLTQYGGSIICGTNMIIDSFDWGYAAEANSYLVASGCKAMNCVNGFVANNNSSVFAKNSSSYGNTTFGYYANFGSQINCQGSIASNNLTGFFASMNSSISATCAVARCNSSCGFHARWSATIELNSSSVSSGNAYGILAAYGSLVSASSASVSGNTSANYFPALGTIGNTNSLIAN